MHDDYQAGFRAKCVERGISPDMLLAELRWLKQAAPGLWGVTERAAGLGYKGTAVAGAPQMTTVSGTNPVDKANSAVTNAYNATEYVDMGRKAVQGAQRVAPVAMSKVPVVAGAAGRGISTVARKAAVPLWAAGYALDAGGHLFRGADGKLNTNVGENFARNSAAAREQISQKGVGGRALHGFLNPMSTIMSGAQGVGELGQTMGSGMRQMGVGNYMRAYRTGYIPPDPKTVAIMERNKALRAQRAAGTLPPRPMPAPQMAAPPAPAPAMVGTNAPILKQSGNEPDRADVLAPLAVFTAASEAPKAGYLGLLGRLFKTNDAQSQAMLDLIKSRGIGLTEPPMLQQARGIRTSRPLLSKIMERIGNLSLAYNPMTNEIHTPKHLPHAGILAHELGHSTQQWFKRKPGLLGYALSKNIPGVAALGALMTKNEDTGRNFAVGGSVAGIPSVLAELQASHRGSQLMKALPRAGRLARVVPYVGVPTYLLASASPLLAYKIKQRMGRYSE